MWHIAMPVVGAVHSITSGLTPLLSGERKPNHPEILDNIFRLVHTIKGTASPLWAILRPRRSHYLPSPPCERNPQSAAYRYRESSTNAPSVLHFLTTGSALIGASSIWMMTGPKLLRMTSGIEDKSNGQRAR